jgi:hypothetical protein
MPVGQKDLFRRIGLLKNQMPNGPESCNPPCLHELVHLMPSVKADAKCVFLQNSENLLKSGLEPIRPVIVRYLLSVAALTERASEPWPKGVHPKRP